jgi:uncharacterized protein
VEVFIVKLSPTQGADRIQVLDVLRGLAIFGILLLNIKGFSQPMLYISITGQELWKDGMSHIVNAVITILGEGKFYSIFSFLFGLGSYLLLSRNEEKGIKPHGVYFRRMTLLLVFGLLHAFLLWWGDILVMYALGGFLLFAFYRRAFKTLFVWIVVFASTLIGLVVLSVGLMALLTMSMPEMMAEENLKFVQQYEARIVEAIQVYQTGSWSEIYSQRLHELGIMYSNGLLGFFPIFTMFLAGMYAGRKKWFEHKSEQQHVFKKAQIWGLAIGLPLSILFWVSKLLMNPVAPGIYDILNTVCLTIGTPALAIFYISSVVLWNERKPAAALWKPLANVGRMALSNYIFQTLICTTLFYGYGFALYGKVSPALGVLITIAVYAVQVILSAYWLRHFRFGPVEWLWRSLTYLRLQPIKK